MAMTLETIVAEYRFQDREESVSTIELHLPDTTPLVDAITYFDAVGELLNNLTHCNMLEYTLRANYLDTAADSPDKLVDAVARVGIFEVQTQDNQICVITVPSLNINVLETDAVKINQALTNVQNFINALVVGDGTVVPCDQRGQDLVPTSGVVGTYRILQAYKAHNRSQINHLARGG